MTAKTLTDAARQVLEQSGKPMLVADIWAAIRERELYELTTSTPEQTMATELMRRTKGVSVSKAREDKRFYRDSPGTYGLLDWLTADQLKALDQEEALLANATPTKKSKKGKDLAKWRQEFRASSTEAEGVLRRECTTDESAKAVSGAFAEVIELAHGLNPMIWSVTLKRRKVHLNVGRCLALAIGPDGIFVALMRDQLDSAANAALAQHSLELSTDEFKSIPGSTYVYVPPVRFAAVWPAIRTACHAFVRTAAQSSRRTPYSRSHSPGFLGLLREVFGLNVPDPGFAGTSKESTSSSLETLFEEFESKYLETAKGEEHLRSYESARVVGRSNFEALRDQLREGKDITDGVLLKLLPHLNSEGNRSRVAWIHGAPAVTKDLKSWFEGAGWAEPDQWPTISKAIWEFVAACEEDPKSLPQHCTRFAAHEDIKGIQSGMLSPILNALRPEDFYVVNGKSRKALNYFANTKFRSKLEDYPEANATLHDLVEKQKEILSLAEYPDVSEADVFDVFSHWLIGIRKSLNIDEVIDDDDDESGDDTDNIVVTGVDVDVEEPELQPPYTKAMFFAETGFSDEQLEKFIRILRRKKQMVLQGPPGTGKTYVAERLGRYLVANTNGLLETVQFHPAYAYEDFMRGIRPRVVQGTLSYEWEDGRFVSFCGDAAKRDKPCVLIIDEINRANLARVFGELMYLLEYRDEEIPLAGGEGRFSIPKNVFVLGTMNTADRSIARLDHALRRRFSFVRLGPEYDVLRKHLKERELPADSLVEALTAVNRLIADPNYEVGISYFMREDATLRDHLPDIWKFEIETYLDEFFYDQTKKVADFRWEVLSEKLLSDWK